MENDDQSEQPLPIVIVAEQYPISRAALVDLLTGDGYRVFQAENVDSAMLCIDRNKDAAVLLADLDMPGWRSLVRHTVATAPNALVIAMLGSQPIDDFSDLRRRGIRAWLAKPLVYDDIRRVISSKDRQPAL